VFLENEASTVRSNALHAVERTAAYSSTFAHLRTPIARLRASSKHLTRTQCSPACKCTCVAVERRCNRLPHFCICANERTYLRSNAHHLATPTDLRQVSLLFSIFLFYFILFLVICLSLLVFVYFIFFYC
jgi:hypothetical protein